MDGGGRYAICKIEILVGVESGRTYRTESSTGNLIGHLLADHEVTNDMFLTNFD